jgi:hypothetical protein
MSENMSKKTDGRYFEGGAYRDTAQGKPDYAKYLSPEALRAYGRYMLRHQYQSDGQIREGDNWKKGIPLDVFMSSAFRHFLDWWELHNTGFEMGKAKKLELMEEALCAVMFNTMGYLHELMKDRRFKEITEQGETNG